ncbi:hypothetical protein ZHAS_00020132 [Anopheles sinensis]|uniref:Uncharacterized protein n=1 Tax=Anopheles sinensis TaxID=74873 RepID=A0A084WP19_ANOSI|nr:hypothetical protein ZHAS_00020132 [Anopheles sinensis]
MRSTFGAPESSGAVKNHRWKYGSVPPLFHVFPQHRALHRAIIVWSRIEDDRSATGTPLCRAKARLLDDGLSNAGTNIARLHAAPW